MAITITVLSIKCLGNQISSIKFSLEDERFKKIFTEEPTLELSLGEKGKISLGEKCGTGVSRQRINTFKNKRGTKITSCIWGTISGWV